MDGRIRTPIAVVFFTTLFAIVSTNLPPLAGEEPPNPPPAAESPHDGVLLLRDGGLLKGKISTVGDRYVVVCGSAELSISAANVAMACRSLLEVYQRQQVALPTPATADAHLVLADWCLQSGLYPQASEQLQAARAIDPRAPKLELLERRLAVVGRATPNTADASDPSPSRDGEDPVPQAPPTSTTNRPRTLAQDLPVGVVERFTRKVQPMLVNNCTIAGCHRPGGTQTFQLDRALLHGMANRRSTMQNLAAVLALVDHARPQESPLLTVPRRDHGGMNQPIFGPRQSAQHQQLVDWVALVTNTTTSPTEAAADNSLPVASAPGESRPLPARHREPVQRVTYDKQGQVETPPGSRHGAEIPVAPAHSAESTSTDESLLPPFASAPLRYGVKVRSWQPKDPFDPEIFNRQTRQAAQSPNQSAVSPD